MREMSWALGGRMAVWTVLIIVAYCLIVVAVAKLMAWLGSKYPQVYATREETSDHNA